MKKILLIILLMVNVLAWTTPDTFYKATKYLTRMYHIEYHKTFYADADIIPIVIIDEKPFPYKSGLTLDITLLESPYTGDKYTNRKDSIEWEHIVPTSWMATVNDTIYKAYYDGDEKCVTSTGNTYTGRLCAEKVSMLFRYMESDMHNLVPVIGSLNAIRSNKNFGIIEGESREFGDFDIEINSTTIEVPENKRGDVARILLYMHEKYNIIFPDHNNTMDMIQEWNELDPEDEWEQRKRELIDNNFK